jgi:hypothetical protein
MKKQVAFTTLLLLALNSLYGQAWSKKDSALFTTFSLPIVDTRTTGIASGPDSSIISGITTYPHNYHIFELGKNGRLKRNGYAWAGKLWDGQEYLYRHKKIWKILYFRNGQLLRDSVLAIPISAQFMPDKHR